jgi:carboxyl-terminal processing protease
LDKHGMRGCLGCILALFWMASLLPPLRAALPSELEGLRQKALDSEKKGQWTAACDCYDKILKVDRTQADIRERYQVCLRHAQQLRRHRDPSLRALFRQPFTDALNAYEEVLHTLQGNYVEKDRIRLGLLFHAGLQELRFALEDDAFLQEQLPDVSLDKIRAFAAQLEQWPERDFARRAEVREQVRGVCLAGLDAVGLNPSAVIVEFAAGACTALDEYTAYLTPAQLNYVQASLKGEYVGVGLEVGLAEQKLVVAGVLPGSPAAEKGLKPGDRILRIDGQPAENQPPEVAMARLLGKVGSALELEVLPAGDTAALKIRLVRQLVLVPSVERSPMPQDGVGYVRIVSFQDSTVQELKDAVLHLQTAGMKVLVLDVRGNGGGSFPAAVQVAEMFLTDGTIVSTDSQIKRFRNTFKSHNPNAWTMPLVLLIDADTASAAEVLAGALKENARATLVGSTTFGKGCVQCVLPLDRAPAGIKITVMKFFSPTNQPYSGRGVSPHVVVDVNVMDAQRNAAWQQARQMAMMLR